MRSPDPATTPGPGRRKVLAGTALALPLLAAGCKGVGALGTPPRPLRDVAVLTGAIDSEEGLIARYEAAFAAVPALASRLGPVLTQHREHLARLRGRLTDARASSAPRPSATPSAPSSPAAAVGYLRAAEQTAAVALVGHLDLVPPSLAQLLASIAASEATHAVLLAEERIG